MSFKKGVLAFWLFFISSVLLGGAAHASWITSPERYESENDGNSLLSGVLYWTQPTNNATFSCGPDAYGWCVIGLCYVGKYPLFPGDISRYCSGDNMHANAKIGVPNNSRLYDIWYALTKNSETTHFDISAINMPAGTKICLMGMDSFGHGEQVPLLLPDGVCGSTPPLNVSCSVQKDLIMDHGSLSAPDLDSHSVSDILMVQCNAAVGAEMQLLSKDRISLQDNLSSSLSINGAELSKSKPVSLRLNSGANSLSVTSTLHASGTVPAGSFSGSDILLMSLY